MKNVPCLVTTLFLGAVLVANTKADNSAPQAPSVSETLSLQDPDGTPLAFSHPKPASPSPADIDAEHKRDQEADANKNWLLDAYEKQLQLRAAKEPGSQDNNLYYRIASDKRLSQTAGVSSLESPTDTASALRTGVNASGKPSLGLRSDSPAPPGQGVVAPAPISRLTPLITPFGATDAAGLHNFFGSSPSDPPPTVPQNTAPAPNPADMEIPGKIAAESDPLAKDSLTFASDRDDALPDKVSHNNDGSLPLGTNAAQLQRLNNAALNVPGAVKTVQPANNVTSLKIDNEPPPPPPKLAAPSPVRQPISNPFSILDR